MRILHVCQNYFPSPGGPQYTMKHVSEKLVSYYNDQVEVATTNSMYGPETKLFEKIDPARETINGVVVQRLSFNRWHYPLLDFANKVYATLTGKKLPFSIIKRRWNLDSPAIDAAMKQANADVIMATTILYNFADYPLWRHKTKNAKPFVLYGAIHLHKPLPNNSPLITRAKACDCYIANTKFEKDELVKYGVEADKIVVTGTGIELSDFNIPAQQARHFRQQHNIADTDVLIGFIGRLVKGKGVGILLDAFRQLYKTNKHAKLLLAGGTTDYVAEIKRINAEENLPVVLIENFNESIKPVLYQALNIFVLASQSESFGVVFLEAWACKKPVIGTRLGAIQSLLSENTDSLLFDAGNSRSLQAAIQTLIDQPGLCQQLGENGYNKVLHNYTWQKVVSKYREAYQLGINKFKSSR